MTRPPGAGPAARPVDLAALFLGLGLRLDPGQAEALGRYLELLARWSRAMNLTGFKDPASAAAGLLADAAPVSGLLAEGARVLDVGAGAGGLAVALSVLRPDLSLVAVEPRGRRAAFVRAARRELGLSRLEVVEGRAETLEPGGAGAAYARAVMAPAEWIALGRRLVRPGGRLLCLTATPLEAGALPEGVRLAAERRYVVPGSRAPRVVTALDLRAGP